MELFYKGNAKTQDPVGAVRETKYTVLSVKRDVKNHLKDFKTHKYLQAVISAAALNLCIQKPSISTQASIFKVQSLTEIITKC